MKPPRQSLAFQIPVRTGVGLVLSLVVCMGIRLLLNAEDSLERLWLHDVGHTVLVGLVVYGVCLFTIRQAIVRPVTAIFLHLYRIGDQDSPEPLTLDAESLEIQGIVDGINLMAWRRRRRDNAEDPPPEG